MADFPAVRLHVVTGKGGTGKTTVAAALALALAHGGHRVLLVEVEGRQGLAQILDTPPLPYQEKKVAVAPGGGDVYALAVDTEQALLDYLHMFYKISPTGLPARTLRRIGAIDFATTIAPGVRDVLLTGKVKEVVTRKDGTRPWYDAVVLDAPPTGRIGRFLNITHQVSGIARVGPLKAQSDGVMAVLQSKATAVHLVTLLEEMPVQETLDAVEELQELGLPVGGIVVNMVRAPALEPAQLRAAEKGQLDLDELEQELKEVGLDPTLAPALAQEAEDHAVRVSLEERGRDVLNAAQRPTYELPALPEIDLGSLYALADLLRQQGMVP
ncbi:MAG TPA: ArsA-related P-loop ATPase [Mycobacteriales bacterium]|nr:ArsA-related P-loop ATPase [Mycobacteriales bacterium]